MKKVIDISEHQKYIDFKKVKQAGIDTVIIRVGWIGNKQNHTIDSYFEEYYKQARLYDFKIGFYVYSYCKYLNTLLEGAEWVYNRIKNKTFDFPIFLDLEDSSTSNLSKTELTEQAKTFCKYFERKGIKAGVYANKYWFTNKLNISELLNYKIWIAEYNGKNNHTLNNEVFMWQYTSKGKVEGISGNVDMNYLYEEQKEDDVKIYEKGDFEVKKYRNGSTKEIVFADINCLIPIRLFKQV